ncbi:MAG: HD domain-containing protein [Methylophilaceae bacterium]
MNPERELSRLHFLFDNDNPDQVWTNAREVIRRISPNYNDAYLSEIFNDVVELFYGDYPDYLRVNTPYHDLRHTMDVFLCALRLMHGMRVNGERFENHEISAVAIAALMHDVGYAQQRGDEAANGAKYTKTHVMRGIEFLRNYVDLQGWSVTWLLNAEAAIHCTNPALKLADIEFENERSLLIAKLVGTADLVGQMADRSYLEKLLFLYFEFKEAGIQDFSSMSEMLQRTHQFYQMTIQKLNTEFDSYYKHLTSHFVDWFGVESNYYMHSIDKNIDYLEKVLRESGAGGFLNNLKRRGIVNKALVLNAN